MADSLVEISKEAATALTDSIIKDIESPVVV